MPLAHLRITAGVVACAVLTATVTTAVAHALQPAKPATASTTTSATAPAPVVRASITTGCTRPAPTTVAGYTKAMNSIRQGGDAALSVKLPSGHIAWIYGDTFIPGVGTPHSTVIMQNKGCFTPTRAQLLPTDKDGTWWWPGAAATLPNGTVLITAGNGYGHRMRGAIARELRGKLVFDHWLRYWPQPTTTGPTYTGGLLVDGATLRVYGTRLTGTTFGKELWLASVPLSGLATATGWKLGTGPILGATPHGTDTAIAAYKDAKGYHLLTLQDSVFGDGPLISFDSRTPAGPFTVRTFFRYSRAGQWRYNAAVHPEARLSDGKLLVTINNNWPLSDTTIHPVTTYQPSYFEVMR